MGFWVLMGLVSHVTDAMFPGAVGAAIHHLAGRDAVTNHPALTMGAAGRHVVDGTLKAIVSRALPIPDDFERMDVIVAANLAGSHCSSPRPVRISADSSTAVNIADAAGGR
jgi:hypothetical protein